MCGAARVYCRFIVSGVLLANSAAVSERPIRAIPSVELPIRPVAERSKATEGRATPPRAGILLRRWVARR